MNKTVVIGGGAIGLLSAFELRQRGGDVVVLDKGNFGRGASSGNAGWVTPSLSGPVPAPGIVWDSLKWMLRPDSPLYVNPLAVPRMAGWLLSFWRHCSEKKYRAGLAALTQLNRNTLHHFDALLDKGLDFEMHRSGLMYVCMKQSTLDELLSDPAALGAPISSPPICLGADEVREWEPALRPNVAGAVFVESERHIRPESLMRSLIEWLKADGVELRSNTEVLEFAMDDNKVRGVHTRDGMIAADNVVLATGAEAEQLAQKAGFNLPVQAGKGYSMTIDEPRLKLGRSMYLVEGRVALTPFNGSLRVAGTMELSGINNMLDERRLEGIKRSTDRYLTNWQEGKTTEHWVGMRPMLPDGLPAIGRAPGIDNLFVATGHAMLGITLGPTTATIIADLITRSTTDYDLQPFNPGRFDRRLSQMEQSA